MQAVEGEWFFYRRIRRREVQRSPASADCAGGIKREFFDPVTRYFVALALLSLSACGDRSADNGSVPIRVPLATSSAALPETASSAAPLSPLAVWTHSPSARVATYGPANAPTLLTITCEGLEQHAARLVIMRYVAADKGAEALFAIQGSKGILRLPVSAVQVGQRGSVWRGILDAGDPRAEVLLGSRLKATVPGGGELDLPPMGAAGAVVSECVVRQAQVERTSVAQTLPNLDSKPDTSPADR